MERTSCSERRHKYRDGTEGAAVFMRNYRNRLEWRTPDRWWAPLSQRVVRQVTACGALLKMPAKWQMASHRAYRQPYHRAEPADSVAGTASKTIHRARRSSVAASSVSSISIKANEASTHAPILINWPISVDFPLRMGMRLHALMMICATMSGVAFGATRTASLKRSNKTARSESHVTL
jgi:hypothetical protein